MAVVSPLEDTWRRACNIFMILVLESICSLYGVKIYDNLLESLTNSRRFIC